MKILNPLIKALIALPVISAMCLLTTAAHAKKQTAEISGFVEINVEPTFYVLSDGQQYTKLSSEKNPLNAWQIPARLKYNPGSNDRIKSYHLQLRLKWEENGQTGKFDGSHVSKKYGLGSRPKSVDKAVSFPINGSDIESFVVNACNARANGFRNIGQNNDLIFSREYHVSSQIYASHAFDTQPVPPGTFESGGYFGKQKYAKIVCMKTPAPKSAPVGLEISTGVTDSSLNIVEQTTLGGACKVNLASTIKTNLPNTTVKYRFEHINGKKSDIKTVKTDHSKTAMDAHWYDIPKDPNQTEAGSVRIVGVSHNFQSAWKSYNMDCRESGPNGLSLVTKPTVSITLQPTNKVMYKGQLCPTKIKVTATLSSQKNFSGTGVVTLKNGSHSFASHDVNLSPQITWRHYETFDLKPWNTINASSGSAGGSNTFQTGPETSSAPLSQRFEIRYNLNTKQQNVVTTPYKTISVSCGAPMVNPHVLPSNNGGITTAPKPIKSKQKSFKFKAVPVQKQQKPAAAKPLKIQKKTLSK